ncbi:MAG TPA: ABC transporter substrate-binding protein [Candidatus Limnocylindria bacterium]|nr:ABC transporter substrate-binding protein [Candidatus Limnocylindria bacterium]
MRQLRIPGLLLVAVLVLSACGTSGPSGMLEELGDGEGELNLIIWSGYAEDGSAFPEFNWVTPFEDETGCIVNSTVMADSAAGVQLLRSGEYDGGSFSGNATDRLMAAGDVAPVNVDLLPNYANVFDGLKLQAHNSLDGVPYGMPHGRGPNLLAWNTDEVEPQTTQNGLWEDAAQYAGRLSIFDSPDFIADASLHLMATQPDLGIENPYQLTQEQFDAAIALLEEQNTHDPQFWNGATFADQITAFAGGDIVIGTTWQFQVNNLADSPIDAVKPAEGATGWSDTWMIASEAEHPNCMYMWMNHMASAEANGQATVYFGEASTSPQACEYAETIAPGHCELTHADDEEYWEDIWYWSTAREDCADDDDSTTCVDYDAWTEAWTTLRGG